MKIYERYRLSCTKSIFATMDNFAFGFVWPSNNLRTLLEKEMSNFPTDVCLTPFSRNGTHSAEERLRLVSDGAAWRKRGRQRVGVGAEKMGRMENHNI